MQRLWLASAGLLVAAFGLWVGVVRLLPVYAMPRLPWWSLVALFFAADRWPLTVNVRRGTPALGMASAPLIIGLFFTTPLDLLFAYAAGVTASPLSTSRTASRSARRQTVRARCRWADRADPAGKMKLSSGESRAFTASISASISIG